MALGLVTALCIGASFESRLYAIQTTIQTLLNEEKPMTFTWNTAGDGGSTIEVELKVPRDEGETVEAWKARARSELNAMQEEFPPV